MYVTSLSVLPNQQESFDMWGYFSDTIYDITCYINTRVVEVCVKGRSTVLKYIYHLLCHSQQINYNNLSKFENMILSLSIK